MLSLLPGSSWCGLEPPVSYNKQLCHIKQRTEFHYRDWAAPAGAAGGNQPELNTNHDITISILQTTEEVAIRTLRCYVGNVHLPFWITELSEITIFYRLYLFAVKNLNL